MRKPIGTAALALLIIGAGAYLILQPKKGSVEWHRREYLAAANRLAENRLIDRLRHTVDAVVKTTPAGLSKIAPGKDIAKIEEHRKALVQLGYLTEKQFALYYRSVDQVKLGLAGTVVKPPGVINGRCWIARDTIVAVAPQQVIGHFATSPKHNTIVVTASPDVIGKCEDEIRKADVR